jgi:pyruvate dehydrogenase E1 component alpha subunit/2-oxoisovalerate dehydrogenase E1 component alpha subunit
LSDRRAGPPDAVTVDPASPSRERVSRMLRDLLLLRAVDDKLAALQRRGAIGFAGSCRGQEAVPVGVAHALSNDDWVFPALRESGVMLVRGFPLHRYFAQAFGNCLDVLKGRQMPCHMSGREVRVVSWSSVVGSQIPHAVGAAYAVRLRGDPLVAVAFLGDGATSTGDFHAGMNLAGLLKVPCLLVCQNNQFAISTPISRQTAARTLADKASSYGVAAERIDGNDVLGVLDAAARARARALAGAGPTFIECVTYRMGPHSSSDDPSRYRDAQEVERWAERDPIERLRAHCRSRGLVGDQEFARLAADVSREVETAVREVAEAGPPPRASLFDDVFAVRPSHLDEQLAELERL